MPFNIPTLRSIKFLDNKNRSPFYHYQYNIDGSWNDLADQTKNVKCGSHGFHSILFDSVDKYKCMFYHTEIAPNAYLVELDGDLDFNTTSMAVIASSEMRFVEKIDSTVITDCVLLRKYMISNQIVRVCDIEHWMCI
jgi:hypothetical protein